MTSAVNGPSQHGGTSNSRSRGILPSAGLEVIPSPHVAATGTMWTRSRGSLPIRTGCARRLAIVPSGRRYYGPGPGLHDPIGGNRSSGRRNQGRARGVLADTQRRPVETFPQSLRTANSSTEASHSLQLCPGPPAGQLGECSSHGLERTPTQCGHPTTSSRSKSSVTLPHPTSQESPLRGERRNGPEGRRPGSSSLRAAKWQAMGRVEHPLLWS